MPYQTTTNVYHLYSIVKAEETSSTDLEEINTDGEITDISNWSDKERKKLQHMTEFHQEFRDIWR